MALHWLVPLLKVKIIGESSREKGKDLKGKKRGWGKKRKGREKRVKENEEEES